VLSRISNPLIRDVIIDMTQKNPECRTNIQTYRHILEGRKSPAKMVSHSAYTGPMPSGAVRKKVGGLDSGSEGTSAGGEASGFRIPKGAMALPGMGKSGMIPKGGMALPGMSGMTPLPGMGGMSAAKADKMRGRPLLGMVGGGGGGGKSEANQAAEDDPGALDPESAPFPPYFSTCIHSLFQRMHLLGITPDDRVALMCEYFSDVVTKVTGHDDPAATAFFKVAMRWVPGARVAGAFSKPGSKDKKRDFNADIIRSARMRPGVGQEADFKPLLTSLGKNQLLNDADSKTLFEDDESKLRIAKRLPTSQDAQSSTESKGEGKPSIDIKSMNLDQLMSACKQLIDEADTDSSTPSRSNVAATTDKGVSIQKSTDVGGVTSSGLTSSDIMQQALLGSHGADLTSSFCGTGGHVEAFGTFRATILESDMPKDAAKGSSSSKQTERQSFEGLLLPVQIICSSFRHLRCVQSKMVSLMILVRFGLRCTDEVILQRIVPTLIFAINDTVASIRAMSVRALRVLLAAVKQVTTVDSQIFSNYIFPAINNRVLKDPDAIVRVAFAESIGRLAETAKRFLDQTHLAVQSKSINSAVEEGEKGTPGELEEKSADAGNVVEFPYDAKLKSLHDQIKGWINELVFDSGGRNVTGKENPRNDRSWQNTCSVVKRVLMVDILRLCIFFGQESTIDVLLQYLLTFLNDQDWELRYAFCAKIPTVCAFVGPTVSTECILPCIENALADVEERVVARAIQCLTTLLQMGLLSKFVIVDIVTFVTPLLLHPLAAIRNAALQFCVAATSSLGQLDSLVFIHPKLKPVLRYDLFGADIDMVVMQAALRTPVTRMAYRHALQERLKRHKDLIPFGSPRRLRVRSSVSNSGEEASDKCVDHSDVVLVDAVDAHHDDDMAGDGDLVSEGAFLDSDETAKIQVLSNYLDRAAQEIQAKALQSLQARFETSSHKASKETVASSLDSLLDANSTSMSEHHLDSFLVPHQKYGIHYFPPMYSEKDRKLAVTDPSSLKNVPKLRYVYGLAFNQGEAARALTAGLAGVLDQWENQLASFGITLTDVQTSNKSPLTESKTKRQNTEVQSSGKDEKSNAAAKIWASSGGYDARMLIRRIKALGLPPLPPHVGQLQQPENDRAYNSYTETLDKSAYHDPSGGTNWRPKENVLVASLLEHTRAVTHISVANDHSFFASGSEDKTVKIWKIRGIDKSSYPRSAYTYDGHKGAVLATAVLENSHTVASAADDGSIHVWRVDFAGSSSQAKQVLAEEDKIKLHQSMVHGGSISDFSKPLATAAATGTLAPQVGVTEIRQLQVDEGPVVAIGHYNGDTASVLTYVTQKGGIHGWDLRAVGDAFKYNLRPELGHPTSITLAPDRNWICVGTSRGYISLWDIRYNLMSKLWRHSSNGPIHRLACRKALPKASLSSPGAVQLPACEGAYLFVAAGKNEASVFGIPEGGECMRCFRSIPMLESRNPLAQLPQLNEVHLPRHPHAPIVSAWEANHGRNCVTTNATDPSIRAIMGRITASGSSYLVTAGTDKLIRYWDFSTPQKCFAVSGLQAGQPKPTFETPSADGLYGKLFLSYDSPATSQDSILQAHLPLREGRGPQQSNSVFRDSITDLKSIDIPMRMMISASKDGEIKLWR
jgi:phosphoinositide-3-kinase regulatory subunit 4